MPFKNGSIQTLTTLVGMQNIEKPDKIFGELKRICSGSFYSICSFCPENDNTNKAVLEQCGNDKAWIKNRHIAELSKHNWTVHAENSIIARVEPTPTGQIAKGFGIDGFPVVPGSFEYCTLKCV